MEEEATPAFAAAALVLIKPSMCALTSRAAATGVEGETKGNGDDVVFAAVIEADVVDLEEGGGGDKIEKVEGDDCATYRTREYV